MLFTLLRAPRLLAVIAVAAIAAACASTPRPIPCDGPISDESDTFILCGDARPRLTVEVWRDRSDAERIAVTARMAQARPAFVLNTGDLVTQGDSRTEWARFDREMAVMRDAGVPYFAGLGNHDLAGDEQSALLNFFARFPTLRHERSFVLRHRDCAIVQLDTNYRSMQTPDRIEQAAWLTRTLDALQADPAVRIVILGTHHPPFTNVALHEPSGWVRDTLVPIAAARPKVRAVVSGHAHTYERFRSGTIDCFVSGGAGAPLVGTRPREQWRFDDLYDGPRRFHFLRCTHRDDAIDIEVDMLLPDGRWDVVDRVTLPKSP
jgi:3',5'-cyclic AMP phosphodiesterase CpdA